MLSYSNHRNDRSKRRTKTEVSELKNKIIQLRKEGRDHREIMELLSLKEDNYFKYHNQITSDYVLELENKNKGDVAECIKLAEMRLSDIYKLIDRTIKDEKVPYMAKIKAGELALSVLSNLLKIQYDGNKLFKVLQKSINSPIKDELSMHDTMYSR
jgi:hypothetical protein